MDSSSAQHDSPTVRTPEPARKFRRLKELFQHALDEPADARRDWVIAEAGDDAELRDGVLELLSLEDGVTFDLETPSEVELVDPPMPLSGLEEVGPYTVEKELARGGMGRVFRATRENPRRAVALKIMHGALNDLDAIRRFEYESQILADLSHPNVAHVYESGTVELLGQRVPWYAMELIEGGRSLAAAMKTMGPELEPKLRLFLEICAGVHHAHQKGVIHRDLKPGNVLVDQEGRAKLIDFGIAKALTPKLTEPAMTAKGQVMGTLAYMSPEQTGGNGSALDVRVDVYALGVILYQLCTGKLPYRLDRSKLREAAHTICETPPAEGPMEQAQLPADLRLVLLKALAKDPEQRYESAAALAKDIRRFLAHEPIEARPPSVLYQLSRFAGRNRGLVAATGGLFVALVLGAGLSTWGFLEARDAQQRAEAARDTAEQERAKAQRAEQEAIGARDFFAEVLYAADPFQSQEGEMTLYEVLRRASERLDEHEDVDVRTELSARQTLHEVFSHLAKHEDAEAQARRTLELTENVPELREDYLEATRGLAENLLGQHRVDDAEPVLENSLALHREYFGPDSPETWKVRAHRANLLLQQSKHEEAKAEYAVLIREATEHFGATAHETLEMREGLAGLHYTLGDLSHAEDTFRDLVEIRSKTLGAKHPDTLGSYNSLAGVILDRGRVEEADEMFADLVQTYTEVLGEDHEATQGTMARYASAMRRAGHAEKAIPLARKVLAGSVRTYGEDDLNTLISKNNLALALMDAEQFEECEQIYVELAAVWRKRPADAQGSYMFMAVNYARMLDRENRKKEAIAILDEFLERARKDYPADFWLTELAESRRALLSGEGDPSALQTERARAISGMATDASAG